MDYRVRAGDIPEDQTTALLESYSAKLPTSLFLGAALASIAGSLILKLGAKHDHAVFIGQWAAPFLLLGIYNKIVKQHGSDAHVQKRPEVTQRIRTEMERRARTHEIESRATSPPIRASAI